MIPAPDDLYAFFTDDCHNPNYPSRVVAFDDEGDALIVDIDAGCLSKARTIGNFYGVNWGRQWREES